MKTDADRIRSELARAGLSVRAGARALGVSRDKLRHYTEGHLPVPQYLWLALGYLGDKRELDDANITDTDCTT